MDSVMREYDNITIEEIIERELITTVFQPLISFKRKQILGFEALSRGVNPKDNSFINPQILIREAEKYGLILDLDRLFRKKALENFALYYRSNPGSVLSINLESNAIQEGLGSGTLLKAVEKHKIAPSSIVIEILESDVDDITVLKKFVNEYRSLGFMIALDDFGAGFSNWDRIVSLKPDLIKLDRSIMDGIENDFYKQEVTRSIIKLAHNTGSMVIAEGIETADESLKVLELNADILQGFLFGRPSDIKSLDAGFILETINSISSRYIMNRNERHTKEENEIRQFIQTIDRISGSLITGELNLQEETLKAMIKNDPAIECAYILNESGIQTSETVINRYIKNSRSRIFQPDEPGSDQSNKDYFYSLLNGHDKYITDPYISTATGSLCITISKKYTDPGGRSRILCVDIKK